MFSEKPDLRCMDMIIKDKLPFRHAEGSGFQAFVKELQPRYKIPSRKKVAKEVWDLVLI